MTVDTSEARKRADAWLNDHVDHRKITRENALGEEHMALDVLELIAEMERLRSHPSSQREALLASDLAAERSLNLAEVRRLDGVVAGLRVDLASACCMLYDAVQLRDDADEWFPAIDELREKTAGAKCGRPSCSPPPSLTVKTGYGVTPNDSVVANRMLDAPAERSLHLAEINRLQRERDEARDDCEAAEQRMIGVLDGTFSIGDGTAQREIERLHAELERFAPLRRVLRNWDWKTLAIDGVLDDACAEQVILAFANVEAAEAKAKERGGG